MSKLILRYEYDASFFDPKLAPDDFGYLSIGVETDRLSGSGGFWVQWQDVKDWEESLRAFPIPREQPVIAQWGFDMQEGDDRILHLEIGAADKHGNLMVRFEVADHIEPANRVRGFFLTNYTELAAFRTGIVQLMANEIEEAILTGQ